MWRRLAEIGICITWHSLTEIVNLGMDSCGWHIGMHAHFVKWILIGQWICKVRDSVRFQPCNAWTRKSLCQSLTNMSTGSARTKERTHRITYDRYIPKPIIIVLFPDNLTGTIWRRRLKKHLSRRLYRQIVHSLHCLPKLTFSDAKNIHISQHILSLGDHLVESHRTIMQPLGQLDPEMRPDQTKYLLQRPPSEQLPTQPTPVSRLPVPTPIPDDKLKRAIELYRVVLREQMREEFEQKTALPRRESAPDLLRMSEGNEGSHPQIVILRRRRKFSSLNRARTHLIRHLGSCSVGCRDRGIKVSVSLLCGYISWYSGVQSRSPPWYFTAPNDYWWRGSTNTSLIGK